MKSQNWIAVGVVAVLLTFNPVRAQEGDDTLRDKAKALNSVGDKEMVSKIRELLKDKDGLKKLLAEATILAKSKDKDAALNYNASFILARAAHVNKDYDASEFFYRKCVEHAFKQKDAEKQAQVFEGLIDLFERRKRYDEAFFTCQKFLDLGNGDEENIERLKPFVVERMIQILCKQKKFDKAMEMADKMVEADEGGWYFLHRKAEVLRESGKYQEAEKLFKEVIERIDDSELDEKNRTRFIEHCKYILSNVYVDLKQLDKSIEILEELMKNHPENPSFANDLGYILADNNRRIDEAKVFVEKALELDRAERKKLRDSGSIEVDDDKENSAYLDSLAWVLHKQNKNGEALDIMKKVIEYEDSQHPEIYDHLGDIHSALGNKADAVKAWKKAIALDNLSMRDDTRKKTIKNKIEANQ